MSLVVQREHGLALSDMNEAVDGLVDRVAASNGIQVVSKEAGKVVASGKGATVTATWDDTTVTIHVDLPLFARALAPLVRSQIEAELDKLCSA